MSYFFFVNLDKIFYIVLRAIVNQSIFQFITLFFLASLNCFPVIIPRRANCPEQFARASGSIKSISGLRWSLGESWTFSTRKVVCRNSKCPSVGLSQPECEFLAPCYIKAHAYLRIPRSYQLNNVRDLFGTYYDAYFSIGPFRISVRVQAIRACEIFAFD